MKDTKVVNKLEEYRKKKGESQESVAQAINVSRKALERYESGSVMPRIDTAYRLSQYYNKSLDQLFQMTDKNGNVIHYPSNVTSEDREDPPEKSK